MSEPWDVLRDVDLTMPATERAVDLAAGLYERWVFLSSAPEAAEARADLARRLEEIAEVCRGHVAVLTRPQE